MDVAAWLRQLGLERYEPVFRDHEIDWDILPELTEGDLEKLGLPLGPRKKLLKAIAGLPRETDSIPAETARPSGAEADDAEQRQLTVLFCDLVGSTELSQSLDAEELHEVMSRYHDAVAGVVGGFGGHVAKLLGDGVLAYFGWPHAHEDDAERAVRAALGAASAVAGIEAAAGRLAARAGIATGPVVVGDMRGSAASERGAVAGATPNLAARLQAMAEPGEVVINAGTRRLIGGAFALEDAGIHRLKGFAEPVQLWRVRGAARTPTRFDAQHGAGLTEFVGRDHEIGLLRGRWDQAREGEGQGVLISGEAGLGKSRILREFATTLHGEACGTLQYQCASHETHTAFHPIIAEIEATAALGDEDPPEQRLDKLERHLADIFEDTEEAAPLIARHLGLPVDRYPPLEMAPQRRKQRTISLLVERVVRLSRARPLVLLIEDIHWIDPSSLETLDALIDRIQELPALAVMTCRPEFTPQWLGHGHVTVHSLNRLARADGRAIVERLAGGKPLPDEVLARIVDQTDGIPLFVEELTKTVLEAGILEEQADRYVLPGPLPALAIPTTLRDSLMARLDRLAPVKRVIQAAACIGREFDASLLTAATSIESDALEDALEQLLSAELILRRGTEPGRFVFKHALVQDAAYSSLLTRVRRSLHERIARALEDADNADPLELARHHFEAGAYERAARLYLTAGRNLLGASAVPEAISALERGFEAMRALPASAERDRLELALRVVLGAARMAKFGWAHPTISEALEPAFPTAKAFGDRAALGSILWGLWVHYQTRTEFPRAHEWLAELRTVARKSPESDLPVIHDMSAGCQYFWEADYARAVGHTDHLATIYDPARHSRLAALTNHDPMVFAQHWAGSLADWIRGFPDRSVERMEEAMALARRVGHPFNLVFALTAGATSLLYLDRSEQLLANCDEAEKVAEEEALGPFSKQVNVMQWRGGAHVQRGDFEVGHALAEAGNEYWNMSGGRICNAMFRSWIVRGLEGLGRIDEAMQLNAKNIAHCRNTGDRYMEPECVRLQGELVLRGLPPDITAAERLFREAIDIARGHGALSWELRAATSLARLLGAEGRRDEGRQVLEPVLNAFSEGFETADPREAAEVLDALA